ncbi:unnamed protein product [Soboliphyme baturini]|uniref:Secreted protein n=1 Tax=Soboliphyme baturini TaxID=241478 RepID=A0A183IEM0_9BILA|nr:unnamed protein product [Soboliphyme baturini]
MSRAAAVAAAIVERKHEMAIRRRQSPSEEGDTRTKDIQVKITLILTLAFSSTTRNTSRCRKKVMKINVQQRGRIKATSGNTSQLPSRKRNSLPTVLVVHLSHFLPRSS